MIGLGLFPVGGTAFGAGTPDAAAAPPADIPEQANFLDPATGDYVVQDDGSYQRMPLVRHQVMMCLRTVRGSAVHEPDVGLELPTRMDQTFEQRVKGAVILALGIVGDNLRLDNVTTVRSPMGRADILVEYTDLTTGNSGTIRI